MEGIVQSEETRVRGRWTPEEVTDCWISCCIIRDRPLPDSLRIRHCANPSRDGKGRTGRKLQRASLAVPTYNACTDGEKYSGPVLSKDRGLKR